MYSAVPSWWLVATTISVVVYGRLLAIKVNIFMNSENPRKQSRRNTLVAGLAGFAGGIWGSNATNALRQFQSSSVRDPESATARSEFNQDGFLERGPSNRQTTYQEFFRRFLCETGYQPDEFRFELDNDTVITLVVLIGGAPLRVRLLSAEQVDQYPLVDYYWFKARVEEFLSENEV